MYWLVLSNYDSCGRLYVVKISGQLLCCLSCYHVDPNVETGPVKVRLVNESGAEGDVSGRVEVFYSNEWGSICGHSWDLADANVVCRQLGYAHAIRAISYVLRVFSTCIQTYKLYCVHMPAHICTHAHTPHTTVHV